MTQNQVINPFMNKGKVKEVNASVLHPQGGGLKLVLTTATTNPKLLNCPMLPLLTKKWSKFKESLYKLYSHRSSDWGLGYVAELAVQSDVWIMHLLCRNDDGYLDVNGLRKCLQNIKKIADYEKASVHVSSDVLEMFSGFGDVVKEELVEKGVAVVIYTEPKSK